MCFVVAAQADQASFPPFFPSILFHVSISNLGL